MKFNDKTKEIFISQYDYGIPIVFTAKSGFVDGDKIIFTFDNENILNKEYTVELVDNTFTFSLAFTQAEAETILNAKLDSCFTIRYSVKHKRGNEFVDSLINSKVVVNSSVPIIHKRNYLVELENENRALKEAIAETYNVLSYKNADIPEMPDAEHLPGTVAGLPSKRGMVNFYDYDGTLLYALNEEAANSLVALPSAPLHEGLVFQSWTHTLEQITNSVNKGLAVDIGATYITDDGTTRFYFYVAAGTRIPKLQIWISLDPYSSTTIDWGDGSTTALENSTSDNLTVYGEKTDYDETDSDTIICVRLIGGNFQVICSSSIDNKCSMFGSPADNTAVLTKVEFGNNCHTINLGAFRNCYTLSTVAIPQNVGFLGYQAFQKCFDLSAVILPYGLTTISGQCFIQCSGLECLVLSPSVNYIGTYAFAGTRNKSLVIPNGLTSINNNAFQENNALETLVLPDTLTEIRSQAFSACNKIKSINLPNNITSIGAVAFSQCTSLTEINIPSGLTELKACVSYCSNLLKLTIPNSVQSIDGTFMRGCQRLNTVDLSDYTNSDSLPTLSAVEEDIPEALRFIVASQNMKDAFAETTNWSTYADRFVIKEAAL